MTDGDKHQWRALFAAHWNESTGGPAGVVDDCDRARFAARQASRALDALRAVTNQTSANDTLGALRDAKEALE